MSTKRPRLTFDQYQNWKAARALNRYTTFAELRALWHRVRAGVVYGRCSGYQG